MSITHGETAECPMDRHRNPAEYLVLGFLMPGASHGYDVFQHIQREVGSLWHIGRSQLYALLTRLEREDLVMHERIGQENLPAKNIFDLTPKGRAIFLQWRDSPVANIREFRLEFLAKLFFAHKEGTECEKRLLSAQMSRCRERKGAFNRASASTRNPMERRALDYRSAMLEASLAWLERLMDEVSGPDPSQNDGLETGNQPNDASARLYPAL
jgi:PadR family transcriptional regulator, regulatory protein AphA